MVRCRFISEKVLKELLVEEARLKQSQTQDDKEVAFKTVAESINYKSNVKIEMRSYRYGNKGHI